MPKDKDLKRLVRRRMAITGDPYTAARASLGAQPPGPAPGDERPEPTDRVTRWVELLSVADHAHGAYMLLKALPPAQLRAAALSGLAHESWRVRRSCALLLDDVSFTDETVAALLAGLDDEHPKVRKAALHTLTCAHCKPDACALDLRPLLERMASDRDRLVRKAVVGSLWRNDDGWAIELLRRFAADDPSADVRATAARILEGVERKRRAVALLASLPPELRPKVERHRGKWVAVADGRVIAADRSHRSVLRAMRGVGRADADVYCVL
jgi:hypothetical protein